MQNFLSPTDKVIRCEFDRDMLCLTVLNNRREEITITITAKDSELNLEMIRDVPEDTFTRALLEWGERTAWTGLRADRA